MLRPWLFRLGIQLLVSLCAGLWLLGYPRCELNAMVLAADRSILIVLQRWCYEYSPTSCVFVGFSFLRAQVARLVGPCA